MDPTENLDPSGETRGPVGPFRKCLLFLQYFRGGEGEVVELVQVVGGDERVVDRGQRGLLLCEVGVKVVHILRCFLGMQNEVFESDENHHSFISMHD